MCLYVEFSFSSFLFVWYLCVYNIPEVSSALDFPSWVSAFSQLVGLRVLCSAQSLGAPPHSFLFLPPWGRQPLTSASLVRPSLGLPVCLAVVSTLRILRHRGHCGRCLWLLHPGNAGDPCYHPWAWGAVGGSLPFVEPWDEAGLSQRGLPGFMPSPFSFLDERRVGPEEAGQAESSRMQEPHQHDHSKCQFWCHLPRRLNLAGVGLLRSCCWSRQHSRDKQHSRHKLQQSYLLCQRCRK